LLIFKRCYTNGTWYIETLALVHFSYDDGDDDDDEEEEEDDIKKFKS
jgi:hypothetical protein